MNKRIGDFSAVPLFTSMYRSDKPLARVGTDPESAKLVLDPKGQIESFQIRYAKDVVVEKVTAGAADPIARSTLPAEFYELDPSKIEVVQHFPPGSAPAGHPLEGATMTGMHFLDPNVVMLDLVLRTGATTANLYRDLDGSVSVWFSTSWPVPTTETATPAEINALIRWYDKQDNKPEKVAKMMDGLKAQVGIAPPQASSQPSLAELLGFGETNRG